MRFCLITTLLVTVIIGVVLMANDDSTEKNTSLHSADVASQRVNEIWTHPSDSHPLAPAPVVAPESSKPAYPETRAPESAPKDPAAAIRSLNFYSKSDFLRVGHRLAQEDPATRAEILYDLLVSQSVGNGLLRDKLLFFSRREASAAMLPFWTALLDREIPRDQEEVYFLQPEKPPGRVEAVDMAVMEQLRAIDGLAKIVSHSPEARAMLWEVALGRRDMPFRCDMQRLAAIRGLAQTDGHAYLKLSRLLPLDDSLRDDLIAILTGEGS